MADLSVFTKHLGSLTDDELNELLSRLEIEKSRRDQPEDTKGLTVKDGNIVACSHCGSVEFKKHGKKDGHQRYRCKDCGKTFMETSNTMLYRSKLSAEQWKKLIKGIVQHLTLSQIAEEVGISTSGVWYNRQKILDCMKSMFPKQDSFADIAEFDEYEVHMSFRGKRDPAFFVNTLGRLPRHHRSTSEKIEYLQKAGLWIDLQQDPERLEQLLYGDSYIKGTKKDSVCILTGKDRSGNLLLEPTCLGSIESRHVEQSLSDKVSSDIIMVTDGSNAYKWFAELRNIQHEQIPSLQHSRGPFSLAHVNAIHSKLAAYWPDNGQRLPATKYLDLNLLLFWWIEKNGHLTAPQKTEELFSCIESNLLCTESYKNLQRRALPLDTKGLIPQYV